MASQGYTKKYVKVHRITSINDPETGLPSKQIELVEVRPRTSGVFSEAGEEARLIKGIISQFQTLGIFPPIREVILPKLTMFLTEDEYERLGIRFEVNDTYELALKDGAISLKLFEEGV